MPLINLRCPIEHATVTDWVVCVAEFLMSCVSEICYDASLYVRDMLDNMQITQVIETAGDRLTEHPVLGFIIIAMALTCGVPVVAFIMFAIISLVFTFAGFLFVEGTLLAVGCLCMFGCLISMVLVMSVMALLMVFVYFSIIKMGEVINSCERIQPLINNIMATDELENF